MLRAGGARRRASAPLCEIGHAARRPPPVPLLPFGDEAVTFAERTSESHQHTTTRRYPVGNWTEMTSRIAIVGSGRLGSALSAALRDAGHRVDGPHGRGATGEGADLVLLCVPDSAIAQAAALIDPRPLVGHTSGATGLDVLGTRERLALHPLMTVTPDGARFAGAGCAVAGSSARALDLARTLADDLGMLPFEVADADRAAYHCAASIASNFLVTLEDAAERVSASAGVPREALIPLVRASIENWAAAGAERALTGPIARGDEATVARQRAALAGVAPELVELFDALAGATRSLARRTEAADAPAEAAA